MLCAPIQGAFQCEGNEQLSLNGESKRFIGKLVRELEKTSITAETVSALISDPAALAAWVAAAPGFLEPRSVSEMGQRVAAYEASYARFRRLLPDIPFVELAERVDDFLMTAPMLDYFRGIEVSTLRQLAQCVKVPRGLSELHGDVDKYLCWLFDEASMERPAWLVDRAHEA